MKERADSSEKITIPGLTHWGPSEEAPQRGRRERSGEAAPTQISLSQTCGSHMGRALGGRRCRYSRPRNTGSEEVGAGKAWRELKDVPVTQGSDDTARTGLP